MCEQAFKYFSKDGEHLFDMNHTITLAMEGREVPRRRPGRPRKVRPVDDAIVPETLEAGNNRINASDEIVDPEQALELMFKEAEEKRQTSSELPRSSRRRRVPQRYVFDHKSHTVIQKLIQENYFQGLLV